MGEFGISKSLLLLFCRNEKEHTRCRLDLDSFRIRAVLLRTAVLSAL
jgi:hypothetical protein